MPGAQLWTSRMWCCWPAAMRDWNLSSRPLSNNNARRLLEWCFIAKAFAKLVQSQCQCHQTPHMHCPVGNFRPADWQWPANLASVSLMRPQSSSHALCTWNQSPKRLPYYNHARWLWQARIDSSRGSMAFRGAANRLQTAVFLAWAPSSVVQRFNSYTGKIIEDTLQDDIK